MQPEPRERWPLGDKWEEAELKEKIKVPKGSEGSRERMLEASAAEDFKKLQTGSVWQSSPGWKCVNG